MVIEIAAYDVQGPCQAWSGLKRGCVAFLQIALPGVQLPRLPKFPKVI